MITRRFGAGRFSLVVPMDGSPVSGGKMRLKNGEVWNRPDNYTVLNQTVTMAAAIMASKAENIRLMATMFDKPTDYDVQRAAELSAEADRIEDAVRLMLERGGCWT